MAFSDQTVTVVIKVKISFLDTVKLLLAGSRRLEGKITIEELIEKQGR